jgi:hypothetical protein
MSSRSAIATRRLDPPVRRMSRASRNCPVAHDPEHGRASAHAGSERAAGRRGADKSLACCLRYLPRMVHPWTPPAVQGLCRSIWHGGLGCCHPCGLWVRPEPLALMRSANRSPDRTDPRGRSWAPGEPIMRTSSGLVDHHGFCPRRTGPTAEVGPGSRASGPTGPAIASNPALAARGSSFVRSLRSNSAQPAVAAAQGFPGSHGPSIQSTLAADGCSKVNGRGQAARERCADL